MGDDVGEMGRGWRGRDREGVDPNAARSLGKSSAKWRRALINVSNLLLYLPSAVIYDPHCSSGEMHLLSTYCVPGMCQPLCTHGIGSKVGILGQALGYYSYKFQSEVPDQVQIFIEYICEQDCSEDK